MRSTLSTRSIRIAAAAAGVVILAGATTACGSKADKGGGSESKGGASGLSPLEALRKTSQNTDQQKTAKVSGTQSQGTPQGQAKSKMKGEMDWSGGGTTADMTITQTGGGAAAGSPQGSKPTHVRYTKDAMYIEMGQALGGKHWIAYDYDKLSQKAGASGALVKDQMQNNNPSRSVDTLLAGGDVHKAGTATVNGKQTTHYTGTVNVADMTRKQSKDLSDSQLDQISAALKKQGIKNETIDLWIDGDNLLAKKRERYSSKNGKADSTAAYTDYGTKVTVKAPAASETMPFDKLGGGAAGQ